MKAKNKRRNTRKRLSKLVKRVNKKVKSTKAGPSPIRKFDNVQYADPKKVDPKHQLGRVIHIFHSGNYAYVKWNGASHVHGADLISDLKVVKRKGKR
jgi:hypothetical protein